MKSAQARIYRKVCDLKTGCYYSVVNLITPWILVNRLFRVSGRVDEEESFCFLLK